MNVRHIIMTCAGVYALAACSDSSGPSQLPSCGAHGTRLSLGVAQYASTNPATDSGCVTFAANASADTAEYLVLPWSVGGQAQSAPFTLQAARGQRLRLPIAHGEGNYYADAEVVQQLEAQRRVIFRYCDERGEATDAANPNGSVHNIAGICSEARNVVGLMPHPERACEGPLGSADGLVMLQSVVTALTREGAVRGA